MKPFFILLAIVVFFLIIGGKKTYTSILSTFPNLSSRLLPLVIVFVVGAGLSFIIATGTEFYSATIIVPKDNNVCNSVLQTANSFSKSNANQSQECPKTRDEWENKFVGIPGGTREHGKEWWIDTFTDRAIGAVTQGNEEIFLETLRQYNREREVFVATRMITPLGDLTTLFGLALGFGLLSILAYTGGPSLPKLGLGVVFPFIILALNFKVGIFTPPIPASAVKQVGLLGGVIISASFLGGIFIAFGADFLLIFKGGDKITKPIAAFALAFGFMTQISNFQGWLGSAYGNNIVVFDQSLTSYQVTATGIMASISGYALAQFVIYLIALFIGYKPSALGLENEE